MPSKQKRRPGLLITKLFVNLLVLTSLGLLIWSMVNAFGHKWTPGVSFITVVVTLLTFIINCALYNKQKYRAPSMTVTVWCLIGLLLIATFSGVEPFNGYKNTLFEYVKGSWEKSQQQSERNQTTRATPKPPPALAIPSPITVTPPVSSTNSSIIEKPLETIKKLFTVDTSIDNFATMFNQYRESKNLAPLVFKDDLNKVAALRLEEIKRDFSHNSLGGNNKNLAENIVMSTGTLSNTVALAEWKSSPGHNANMLDPTYKYTGYAAGGGYAVQLFTDLATINGVPQLPPGWYWAK